LCFIRILCCARFLARGKKEISIKFNNKAIEKRLLLHIFLSSWCGKKKGQISKYVCIHSMYSCNLLLLAIFRSFHCDEKEIFQMKTVREKEKHEIFVSIESNKAINFFFVAVFFLVKILKEEIKFC
jgi:hypothetical protein